MPLYKAAIIGLGNIGYKYQEYKTGFVTTHFEAYVKNKQVDLVGVCDTDEKSINEVDKKYKINGYFDHKEMMNKEKPELVSICTPDETHYEILKDILEFDFVKAVWCEKPITISLEQAKEIVSLYEKKGVVLLVNFIRRYDFFYEYIKYNLYDLVGDIRNVSFYYGGGLVTVGSHMCDLLRYFFGNCTSVSGEVVGISVKGQVEFQNGITASVIPKKSDGKGIFEMSIAGDKATLKTINKPFADRYYEYSLSNGNKVEEGIISKDFPIEYMEKALEDLICCVELKKDPKSSGKSALDSLEIISGLWYSAKHGEKVKFPLNKANILLPEAQGDVKLWKK